VASLPIAAVIFAEPDTSIDRDPETAVSGKHVKEDKPAALLEFWNRMLDLFIGKRGD